LNEVSLILQVCEADVNALKEMFPDVQENTIRHLRTEQNMSTNDVIDILVSQQQKCKAPSVQSILARHCQQKIINPRLSCVGDVQTARL
jgi:N-acetylglutamate synthase/N-acetylornithine aminotransferase